MDLKWSQYQPEYISLTEHVFYNCISCYVGIAFDCFYSSKVFTSELWTFIAAE